MEYYHSDHVHSIELLALTRMRPIVGSPRLAERVLRIKNNILYNQSTVNAEKVFEIKKNTI